MKRSGCEWTIQSHSTLALWHAAQHRVNIHIPQCRGYPSPSQPRFPLSWPDQRSRWTFTCYVVHAQRSSMEGQNPVSAQKPGWEATHQSCASGLTTGWGCISDTLDTSFNLWDPIRHTDTMWASPRSVSQERKMRGATLTAPGTANGQEPIVSVAVGTDAPSLWLPLSAGKCGCNGWGMAQLANGLPWSLRLILPEYVLKIQERWYIYTYKPRIAEVQLDGSLWLTGQPA